MAKQQRDETFTADDEDCRTVVLDLGDGARRPLPADEEATVVLDLTPTQVHDILTDGKATIKPLND